MIQGPTLIEMTRQAEKSQPKLCHARINISEDMASHSKLSSKYKVACIEGGIFQANQSILNNADFLKKQFPENPLLF